MMMDREELIIFYFSLGYSYKRILNFLSLHGVSLSMRQLKRKLKSYISEGEVHKLVMNLLRILLLLSR